MIYWVAYAFVAYSVAVMVLLHWEKRKINRLKEWNESIGEDIRNLPVPGSVQPEEIGRIISEIEAEQEAWMEAFEKISVRRAFTLGIWR